MPCAPLYRCASDVLRWAVRLTAQTSTLCDSINKKATVSCWATQKFSLLDLRKLRSCRTWLFDGVRCVAVSGRHPHCGRYTAWFGEPAPNRKQPVQGGGAASKHSDLPCPPVDVACNQIATSRGKTLPALHTLHHEHISTLTLPSQRTESHQARIRTATSSEGAPSVLLTEINSYIAEMRNKTR